MNKYNKTELLTCLASIEWMQVFSDLNFDPNRMTDAFHEIFETTLNSHASIRKRKVRAEQTPWLNPSIKSLMRERDKQNSSKGWQSVGQIQKNEKPFNKGYARSSEGILCKTNY